MVGAWRKTCSAVTIWQKRSARLSNVMPPHTPWTQPKVNGSCGVFRVTSLQRDYSDMLIDIDSYSSASTCRSIYREWRTTLPKLGGASRAAFRLGCGVTRTATSSDQESVSSRSIASVLSRDSPHETTPTMTT